MTNQDAMAAKPTTLVLADDHISYREGLKALISHWREFEVVGEASDGLEAVELCRELKPDLVLMDVQMPNMNGVEATGIIQIESPTTKIVMLTASIDDEVLFEAIRTGARGYILKDMPARQLKDRLKGVLHGEAALSGVATAKVLTELNKRQSNTLSDDVPNQYLKHLTANEIQILKLVAHGYSNEAIGAELYLSEGAVKKKLSRLLQKLHLENRVQAAVFAVRADLLN